MDCINVNLFIIGCFKTKIVLSGTYWFYLSTIVDFPVEFDIYILL